MVVVPRPLLRVEELSVSAGEKRILRGITLGVGVGEVLAVIGPAGGGKTTLLRCVNRLVDLDRELRVSGRVYIGERPVLGRDVDATEIRRRVGTVFVTPTTFPMTVKQNVLFGVRFSRKLPKEVEEERVEASLRAAYLWDEVKDRLSEFALRLSGGQQQRLCLARTLALEPEVLLMDEPCSGLDPVSTGKIEEALTRLKRDVAVVLVTNNVKQAARASDRTAFILGGELVEQGDTGRLFTTPKEERTADYISGRMG